MSKIKNAPDDREKRIERLRKRKAAQARVKLTAEMMRMPTPEDRDELLYHVDALLGVADRIAPILKRYELKHLSSEHVLASILEELKVRAELDTESCLMDLEFAYSARPAVQMFAQEKNELEEGGTS